MLTEAAWRGDWRTLLSHGSDVRLAWTGARNLTLEATSGSIKVILPPARQLVGGEYFAAGMPGASVFRVFLTGSTGVEIETADGTLVAAMTSGYCHDIHLLDALSEDWEVTAWQYKLMPTTLPVGEKVLMAPGSSAGTSLLIYDPKTDAWGSAGTTVPAHRPAGVLAAASIGHLLHFGAASAGAPAITADFATTPGVSFAAGVAGDLPEQAIRGTAVSLHGQIYATTGETSGTFYRYDRIRAVWEAIADFGIPRYRTKLLACGNRLFLLPSLPSQAVGLEFDLVTGAWWEMQPWTGTERQDFAAFALGSKLYLCGGLDSLGNALDEVLVYDTLRRRWSQGPVLPQGARYECGGTAAMGWGVIIGGKDSVGSPTTDVARFNGTAWSAAASLTTAESDLQNRAVTVVA